MLHTDGTRLGATCGARKANVTTVLDNDCSDDHSVRSGGGSGSDRESDMGDDDDSEREQNRYVNMARSLDRNKQRAPGRPID